MPVIEEYREAIERDYTNISKLWDTLIMVCYVVCFISGYIAAVTFALFWLDICGQKCPLWATTHFSHPIHTNIHHLDDLHENDLHGINSTNISYDFNWTESAIVVFKHELSCNLFLIINACSCIFGMVWFVAFLISNRDGYHSKMLPQSWKLVFPALTFDFIFVTPCIFILYMFEIGYKEFSTNLHNISSTILRSHNLTTNERECDSIYDLFKALYEPHYNVCHVIGCTRVSTFVMIISWSLSFLILLTRFLLVSDFDIYTINVQDLPPDSTPTDVIEKFRQKNN